MTSPTNSPASGKADSAEAYRRAGVDIAKGDALVGAIGPMAKATNRPGVMGAIGGFGGLFDPRAAGFADPVLVAATDGVGTKLAIAGAVGRHDTIGVDLVAMCVNDLVVQGAEPLFFLDYFATGKLDVETGAAVVAGIADGCRQANCALIGGETAEMPGLYKPGDYDLAGFAVGAFERGMCLPRADLAAGDRVLGLASAGVHSNGFSLVRRVVADTGADLAAPAPFETDAASLGAALLTPTRIYVRACLAAIATGGVKALAHVTGGGLEDNPPRVLPGGLGLALSAGAWDLPPVFRWLRDAGGLDDASLARTFNCGIGMILVVSADREAAARAALEAEGETVFEIGELVPGAGVAIRGDGPAWRG